MRARAPGAAVVLALLLGVGVGCGRPAAPGQPCRWHADCRPLPEGYCARVEVCTRECRDDFPCPDGSRCVAGPHRSTCLATCARDADCAPGFSCRDGVCQVTDVFAPALP